MVCCGLGGRGGLGGVVKHLVRGSQQDMKQRSRRCRLNEILDRGVGDLGILDKTDNIWAGETNTRLW